MNEVNSKVGRAAKWSLLTEVSAKLITPITNMVLARLLTPEAFGIVATATMIFSFADIFTDAGFQNYIVQHEFKTREDLENSATVAFWSNFILSLFLWGIISVFSSPLADVTGISGLGSVFIVSCISLPLTSISSLQTALYKRKFDFKTLFYVRIVTAVLPLVVTVPIAWITRSFWALIVGTIAGNAVRAIILTVKSEWKPRLFFDVLLLRDMFSFSCWSLAESISIWLTSYIGTFIVGVYLTTYYLGIYKTSMSTVNQITNLITSATSPIMFSALSRLQNDRTEFETFFFKFQRTVALVLVPMGMGIFLYKDIVTGILLGKQWGEAQGFIGIWGLSSSISIVLSYYSSEAFRAIGKPKLSVLGQWLHIIVLVPALIYTAQLNFTSLYVTRSLIRFEGVLVDLILMKIFIGINPIKMIKNVLPSVISAIVMLCLGMFMRSLSPASVWQYAVIFMCVGIYFGVQYIVFPKSREDIVLLVSTVMKKVRK